ncbi:glycosyltransferase family 4 protein [Paenibacillus macerans]|uniref:glycosyltransferase family 4 protein n=1 Tax=Paenibacillus macerans TaxID=44252 RepID=UPI003D30F511
MVPGRKKLMLFSHVCNTRNVTGAEKLLLFCARRLTAHYDCTIVVPRQGSLTVLAKRYGIRTLVCGNELLYGMCSPYAGLSNDFTAVTRSEAVRITTELLSRERPDAVFVNSSVNVSPAIAAKQLGIPVVWQITEVIADNDFTPGAVEIVDRYGDLIIGISHSVLSPFQGSPAEGKTVLLYPSWNPEDMHPESWPALRRHKRKLWNVKPSETLVGYISSYLIPEKGADHFLEAALKLAEPFKETRFVVIGAEIHHEYYRDLQRMVQASPYKERFIFANFEDHVEAAFCAMDIVIIPGILPEGFGLTALEAMVTGKPVVAYASGGLREILEATGNAHYLVPTRDTAGIAARCAELLSLPELANGVGVNNQLQAEALFGPAVYEQRLLGLVERMQGLAGSIVALPEPANPPAAEADFRSVAELPAAAAPASPGDKASRPRRAARQRRSKARAGKRSHARGLKRRRKSVRRPALRRRLASTGSRRTRKRRKAARR